MAAPAARRPPARRRPKPAAAPRTGTAAKAAAASGRLAVFVEAAVAAVSALAVLGVIGFLVRDGLVDAEPARLEIRATGFDPAARRLGFAVRNLGGEPVEGVVVSARPRAPDGAPLPRLGVTIEHLPPGSEATGAFVLDAPAEIVVEGWVDP